MKISISIILILFSLFTVAQTTGELLVTTTTSETGGNFAPRNIVAIWIENEQGEFVKTLLAYAQTRKTHLNTWQATTTSAGTAYNTTDAITGATKSSHGTRECSWNGLDYNGLAVVDGTYYVWMELTDKNVTGNYSSFVFTKDENPSNQTPEDVPSFSSISLVWQPTGVSVLEVSENNISIIPNQSNGFFSIAGDNIIDVEVRSISGRLISKSNSQAIDIRNQQAGIYLVIVQTKNTKIIRKVYKY
ncbi:MAG: DUF2271 domain-containing protein [Bacteroidota bacterium]